MAGTSSRLESDESDIHNDDTIKVFLRLKPPSDKREFRITEVIDSRTVIFKMPPEHAQFKKKLNMPTEFKYTFSNIYRDDATQGEVFTGCVAPLVKDLFRSQNGLLFTYGTTNAGKTFTVLGTGDSPGLIPRTLTTVFKSIKGKEYGSPRIKPDMFNAAVKMTDSDLEEQLNIKHNILSWNAQRTMIDPGRNNKTSSSRPSAEDYMGETVFREMQKRLSNDTSIVEYQADSQDRFSVWVSFGEIYNENIYDLLLPVDINRKREALKLAQDKRRNVYIKGLKHVFVQSEEEAYKVLMFGKNNLQVAATGMNLHSSRSHCIFSVKLIKIPNVEKPESVVVSSFAICDLAGAERQKKTLNVGLRLKESQNINCSLHVLSRCFTVLRDNQLHNRNELIPFRDSKLTQLFQHALMGKESVTMIVNVNQEKDLCEETEHVLKATAVAKRIVASGVHNQAATAGGAAGLMQAMAGPSSQNNQPPTSQSNQIQVIQPNQIKELCDKNQNQKLEIEGLIDDVNVLREENKELTMELTRTKRLLGLNDQENTTLRHENTILRDENQELKKQLEQQQQRQMTPKTQLPANQQRMMRPAIYNNLGIRRLFQQKSIPESPERFLPDCGWIFEVPICVERRGLSESRSLVTHAYHDESDVEYEDSEGSEEDPVQEIIIGSQLMTDVTK